MAIAPEITKALEAYDPRAQISPFQMRLIMGVVAQHRFAARFLIHGCGLDSPFWHRLNAHGRTLFVETDEAWVRAIRVLAPDLQVTGYPDLPTTVAQGEAEVDADALARAPLPEWAKEAWDLVLIDGPVGYEPQHPGRALPIFWAADALQSNADIFVDDYQRPLERLHCDTLLRTADQGCAILPGNAGRLMFWRMGRHGAA
jgi:glucuronoxylan 4-O-methyltransferase